MTSFSPTRWVSCQYKKLYKTLFNKKQWHYHHSNKRKKRENVPTKLTIFGCVIISFFPIFKVDMGVEWRIPLCPWLTNRCQRKNCSGSFQAACSLGTVYSPSWRQLWGPRGLWPSLHWWQRIDGVYVESWSRSDCYPILVNMLVRSHKATVTQFSLICRVKVGKRLLPHFPKYAEPQSRSDFYPILLNMQSHSRKSTVTAPRSR